MIEVETLLRLVPGPASAGVDCLPANNNLDLTRFGGRLFLAWRTAPTHWASDQARLHVASAPGLEGPWRPELTVALGTDVREPRFVAAPDALHLFWMELGSNPRKFQPKQVHHATSAGDGTWSEPSPLGVPGVVPWRTRRLQGRWAMVGYRNAEAMYGPRPIDPVVELRWSDDLASWSAPVDVHDGGTECELVELPDGRILGLTRNEGPTRRGGDLLVGTDVEHLAVTAIGRKLDSPHLFLWDGEPFVLARRQLAFGGRYDVVPRGTPGALAIRIDQLAYWITRKRSALYRLEPDGPGLRWVLDLPSCGDTSFAAVVPELDGSLLVADYTSPTRGGNDPIWMRAQAKPTEIWAHRLTR